MLHQLLGNARVTHLDYGGGSGLLSDRLRDKGWDSRSYDPFVQRDVQIDDLGAYDLDDRVRGVRACA